MILDDFCKNVVDNYIEDYNLQLSRYENPNGYYAELPLGNRIEYANEAYSTLQELKEFVIGDCYSDLMLLVKDGMRNSFAEYSDKVKGASKRRAEALETIDDTSANKLRLAEKELKDLEDSVFSAMQNIIAKHASIPRDKLQELISLYKLPVGRFRIDKDNLSIKELEELISISSYAAHSTVSNRKVTDKLLGLIYLPLNWNIADAESASILKISHFLALLILGYLAKPYFMAVVGFIYLVSFLSNLYKVYEREELLCGAFDISDKIDFTKYVYSNQDYIDLKKKVEDLRVEDSSSQKESIEIQYRADLEELLKEDPQLELDEVQKLYNMNMNSYLNEFEKAETIIKDKYRSLLILHEEHIAAIDRHFSELRKNMQPLGSIISKSPTMNMRFKIGSASYRDSIVAEADIELPLSNINFMYEDSVSRESTIGFVKLLITNAICNVREKHLKITIFDPNDLGKDFSEFLSIQISDYVRVVSSDFKVLAESLLVDNKDSIVSFKGKNIQEFNKESESMDKLTKDYHIVIIVSNETDISKDKKFIAFMKYSAKYGIWIWNIAKRKIAFSDNKEDKADYDNLLKDVAVSYKPGTIEFDGDTLGGFESPLSLYNYSTEIGSYAVESLIKTIEENRIDILEYEKGYRLKHIPDEKIWSFSTLKGIEFHPGLLEGDPYNAYAHVLGDDTVHALMGGATGQGKSATINEILASLLLMYPPEELELVMVDFKNVEFSMYTRELLIPHAKIIAGTKDGEYALSVFDYLIEEMKRRTKLFTDSRVQKIEDYNRLMLAKNRKDLYLPRVLVLIDEFQVMFTDVEPKIVEKIKERITSLSKLARFAGCHMWYTSQSMKNTMSTDILEQFKLRLSLFATKETSTDLLGNGAASTIKGKGWIYTNDSGAQHAKSNRLFRVPFADKDYIKTYLPMLINRCKEENRIHRHAVFYDEDTLHSDKDLISVYSNNPTLKEKDGTFILGERTMYSINPLPYGFTMTRDDGEHVMVTCFERESMLNIAQTFIENCIQRNIDYCVHSADKEAIKLLGLKDRVPKEYLPLVEEVLETSDLLDLLEDIISQRESEGVEVEHKEFYFIAVNWEKQLGLGRNEDMRSQEKFKSILQRGGIVNVHIILLVRESTPFKMYHLTFINHRIISKCSERESGNLTDTDKGVKLGKKFGIHLYGSDMVKFKLYQFPIKGEILKREVAL